MISRSFSTLAKRGRPSKPLYWPPTHTSKVVDLPGGRKKAFVFNGKCDRDGSEKPVLCIASRGNERLAFFDEEEVDELIRVSERLYEYTSLWQKKADMNRIRADEADRKRIAADDRIGVDI
jgi:hypothetical protein